MASLPHVVLRGLGNYQTGGKAETVDEFGRAEGEQPTRTQTPPEAEKGSSRSADAVHLHQLLLRNAALEAAVASLRGSQSKQLRAAIRDGSIECLRNLLVEGALDLSVSEPDAAAIPPVCLAAYHGHVDIANTLLAYNADPNNAATAGGATPVLIAAQFGNIDMVRALLEGGADPNKAASSLFGDTPVYLAAGHGNDEIVKLLLEHNANPNSEATDGGDTPALIAAQFGHVDALKVLLEFNADPNKATTDKYGATPVHIAAQYGHVDVVKVLLASNADPNRRGATDGATPLFMAAANGHASVAKVLLAQNADPNKARTDIGATPVYVAAENGQCEVVRVLLAHNADPNKARTDDGSTPIYAAVDSGHIDAVKVLVEHHGDPHRARTNGGNGGWTPLNMAMQKGYTEIAGLLQVAPHSMPQLGSGGDGKARNAAVLRPANMPTTVATATPKVVRFNIPAKRTASKVGYGNRQAGEEEIPTGEVQDPEGTPVRLPDAAVTTPHLPMARAQSTPELAATSKRTPGEVSAAAKELFAN